MLSVAEARLNLAPLTVTPEVQAGTMPETLSLLQRKDENLPKVMVPANGREKTQKWTKEEREEGKHAFHSAVETALFVPTLPVLFEIASKPYEDDCNRVARRSS